MRRSLIVAAVTAVAALASAGAGSAQGIAGAGSTFAHPVLSAWSQAYQRTQSDAEFQPVGAGLDYEPSGSQAGLARLRSGDVAFAATDVPLSAEELTRSGFAQFPIVSGGIVAAVNLPGVAPGALKLGGELLADIYLGGVTRWSDPAIKALNPDLTLPDQPIVVFRRADGSGTTFNFTNLLSRVSPAWKSRVGEGLVVKWPTGRDAKGNGGMAEAVRATANSIGYVEFAQARRSGLSYAALRNRAGTFVVPDTASFQAAASSVDWAATHDFNILLNDAPGEKAYPLVATTFVVLPKTAATSGAVLSFFKWALDNGARTASDLGYVPFPAPVVAHISRSWATTFGQPR